MTFPFDVEVFLNEMFTSVSLELKSLTPFANTFAYRISLEEK